MPLVTIKEGAAVLGTTTADATGAWSFTPAGLTDGAHTLTAIQTDAAGNTGTATLSFTLDKTAPALSIALVSDTGGSATDGITSNPAIKGTGQANRRHHQGGHHRPRHDDGRRHRSLELHPGRPRRRRAHPDRNPDRSGRQHRHGDAELHARHDGAGAEHGPRIGHRRFGERRDHLEPGDQGHRRGQYRRDHQGGRHRPRHDDGRQPREPGASPRPGLSMARTP